MLISKLKVFEAIIGTICGGPSSQDGAKGQRYKFYDALLSLPNSCLVF